MRRYISLKLNRENLSDFLCFFFFLCNFRLEIEDVRSDENVKQKKSQIVPKPESQRNPPKANDDYDDELRRLIIPKKIVRSKLSQAVSNIKQLCSEQKSQKIAK